MVAAGCMGSPTNPGPVDQQLTLAPNQQAQIASGISVRFLAVTTDSRCPAAAICVWAGDAVARFEIVRSSRSAETLDLHTTLQPNQGQASGYTIQLIELAPYPIADPIPSSDYRATVRITR